MPLQSRSRAGMRTGNGARSKAGGAAAHMALVQHERADPAFPPRHAVLPRPVEPETQGGRSPIGVSGQGWCDDQRAGAFFRARLWDQVQAR